jgi:hypothetical protein
MTDIPRLIHLAPPIAQDPRLLSGVTRRNHFTSSIQTQMNLLKVMLASSMILLHYLTLLSLLPGRGYPRLNLTSNCDNPLQLTPDPILSHHRTEPKFLALQLARLGRIQGHPITPISVIPRMMTCICGTNGPQT